MKNKSCGRIICFVFLIMQIIMSCAASFSAIKPIYFSNNPIIGLKAIIGLTFLSFTILLNLFFIKKLRVRYEVRSRFAYDSMNQRFFDLDNKLKSGIITENECKHLKSYIHFDLDFTYALRILYYCGAAFNFVEIIFVIISVVRKLIILKEPVFDKSYNTTIICLLVQTCWFMLFSQPFVYDLFNVIKGFSTLICFSKERNNHRNKRIKK